MHISLTNSKLGDKIPSLNLPAILTCRADAPCKKDCYATRGNWRFPNVQTSLRNNLDEFVSNPDKFFSDIVSWLKNDDITYKFFRWFSSGDIVNKRFLQGIIDVAKECPSTNFLCFTKKYELVNDYLKAGNEIPTNLHIVFSGWDKGWVVPNPFNLPMTFVEFKDCNKNCIPEYAIPCTGSCQHCKSCWSLQKGQSVYFHKH